MTDAVVQADYPFDREELFKLRPDVTVEDELITYLGRLKWLMDTRVKEVRAAGGEVGMDPVYLEVLTDWSNLRGLLDNRTPEQKAPPACTCKGLPKDVHFLQCPAHKDNQARYEVRW